MIENKKFAAVAHDPEDEVFVVHVALISQDSDIHPFCRAYIALIKGDEAPIFLSLKYTDFIDVFSKNLATKLPKHIKINNYAINLIKIYQPSYSPIYNLGLVKLETLKTYIKTNLINGFI